MEFDSTFNPAIIFLGAMIWIGLFGLYGNYLEKKDQKDNREDEPPEKDTGA
mgnify:FL=1